MRQVFCMNLVDNRSDKPENPEISKFRFCKDKSIIGIGWVDYDNPDGKDPMELAAYHQARGVLKAMQPGDLVWVRDPEEDIYYICRVDEALDENIKLKEEYRNHDLSLVLHCKYYKIGSREQLPEGIEPASLISRCAVRFVRDENLRKRTIEVFKKIGSIRANAKSNKKIRNLLIILPVVFALLIAGVITGSILYSKSESKRIESELVGKFFIERKLEFTYENIEELTNQGFDWGMNDNWEYSFEEPIFRFMKNGCVGDYNKLFVKNFGAGYTTDFKEESPVKKGITYEVSYKLYRTPYLLITLNSDSGKKIYRYELTSYADGSYGIWRPEVSSDGKKFTYNSEDKSILVNDDSKFAEIRKEYNSVCDEINQKLIPEQQAKVLENYRSDIASLVTHANVLGDDYLTVDVGTMLEEYCKDCRMELEWGNDQKIIATVKGRILYNPDLPGYYSGEQTIFEATVEDGRIVSQTACSELSTVAILSIYG